jgi:hypothetical protein
MVNEPTKHTVTTGMTLRAIRRAFFCEINFLILPFDTGRERVVNLSRSLPKGVSPTVPVFSQESQDRAALLSPPSALRFTFYVFRFPPSA